MAIDAPIYLGKSIMRAVKAPGRGKIYEPEWERLERLG
jgi:hypothetical protein